MIFGIQKHEVDLVWPKVAPILQRAIDRSQKDYELQDIYGLVSTQAMQLWIWYVDGEIEACCVTQIQNYPRRRVCQMPFIAGGKMRDWLSMEAFICEWAKSKGCSQLEGFARDGWLRVLKNWRKVWTTIRRDI